MAGKRYEELKKQLPQNPISPTEAVEWLKKNSASKFDATVEIHVRLSVDTEKSDQMVRSFVTLPSGSPKEKKIVVFTADAAIQKAATAAGASAVGSTELIDTIATEGGVDADMAIATPDMMPKIAKIARILGPKGLMPNPKTGTVTPDPVAAMKELMSGKIPFKMDTLGNIHEAMGKVSWEPDRLIKNTEVFLDAVAQARPAAVKGKLIKAAYLKTTMSPAIALAV